jgi:hypothetical protein
MYEATTRPAALPSDLAQSLEAVVLPALVVVRLRDAVQRVLAERAGGGEVLVL